MPRLPLQSGEKTATLLKANLDVYDAHAKKILAYAKQHKKIRVQDGHAFFRVPVSIQFTQDIQNLLSTLVNQEYHGAAWAPDESDETHNEAHRQIRRGHGFTVEVCVDLTTGEVSLYPNA